MIEYFDEIGRKRTAPGARNQYLNKVVGRLPPHGKNWHLVDGWSKDLAGKLIAIGWPDVDIEDCKREAKELPAGIKRSDEAKGRLHAYSFFVNLANIAIEAGLLKENDKPARWLEWAESKGYVTDHLTRYMSKIMSDDDAVFFARIDEMLRPFLKPIDYEQADTPAAMVEAEAMIPTAIKNACAELALKFAMMDAEVMIPTHTNDDRDKEPWLIHDPKDPPPIQPWYTPARYFARQVVINDSSLLTKQTLLAGKVVQRLTAAGFKKRGGKLPFGSGTVKKALSNISLG
ncbi:MAG: hypothetical protein Q7U66_11290 [Methylobacter sp.]|nr:hypothetical protein [Methylobacter sp.]